MKIPSHIAVIMDGNGRWAKMRNLPRTLGHKKGIERVEDLLKNAKEIGIKIVTLFAFSTENWLRPKQEIDMLFSYLKEFLVTKREKLNQEGVRVNFIGRRDRLDSNLLEEIRKVEELTQGNQDLILNIALDYGGRWDILEGAKRLAQDFSKKEISLQNIGEKEFSDYLALKGIPEPDLLIRTSGEMRISNFLLWQVAYTELYFTPCLWPDFNKEELIKAVDAYSRRERRFGSISSSRRD